MSSRLPYRNPADRIRKERQDAAERLVRTQRSAGIVGRSAEFQAATAGTNAKLAVIDLGFVANATNGIGLGAPYLALPVQPVGDPGTPVGCGPYGWERGTEDGDWTTLFTHHGIRQNVLWFPRFMGRCSDATTAGEIRAVNLDTGEPLTEFALPAFLAVIPTGTTTDTEFRPGAPGLVTPVGHGEEMRLGVQVRRTAGAGSITLAVTQSIGG